MTPALPAAAHSVSSIPAVLVGIELTTRRVLAVQARVTDNNAPWRCVALARSPEDLWGGLRLKPNAVVVTERLAGVSTLDVIDSVGRLGIPVLMLVENCSCEHETYLLRRGATGVISLEADDATIMRQIRETLRGRTSMSVAAFRCLLAQEQAAPSTLPEFTKRQRDILNLLARGETSKNIAAHLGISLSTVKTHVARMSARCGLTGRSALVAFAARHVEGRDVVPGTTKD